MAFGILEPFELFFSMIRIISRTILLIITLFIAIMSNGLYQAIPGYTGLYHHHSHWHLRGTPQRLQRLGR